MIMTKNLLTLKEALAQCEETHSGFFTFFQMKDGKKLMYKKVDFKGDVTFIKVAHFRTRGGDPRCAFEVGRQMGDTSLLLVALDNGDILIADEKMKFVIE